MIIETLILGGIFLVGGCLTGLAAGAVALATLVAYRRFR